MRGKHGWNRDSEYQEITSLPDDLGPVVGLDTEGPPDEDFSTLRTKPYCVQLSDRAGRGFVAFGDHVAPVTQQLIDSGRQIVTHGGKYEIHVLRNVGIELPIHDDTMLMGFLLDTNDTVRLDAMGSRYLGCNHPKWTTVDYADREGLISYGCGDAELTWRLHELLKPKMDEIARQYLVEMKTQLVLADMERNGVAIDVENLKRLALLCARASVKVREKMIALAEEEFEPNSPAQVGRILFDKMCIPPPEYTKGGKPSTRKEALAGLEADYPIVKLILLFRRLVKRQGTYLEKLPAHVDTDGRVHTQLLQAVTPTKRLASTKPNMMNQPKRAQTPIEEALNVRKAIVAAPGHYLLRCDYSQIEFRLMLYSTGSQGLVSRMLAGEDFHKTTARILLDMPGGAEVSKKQRDEGKTFNYGLAYGMNESGLAFRRQIARSKARSIIDRFREIYPGLMEYIEREQQRSLQTGWSRTFLGRLREVPGIRSQDRREKNRALRNAINDQIQGGAAEIFKLGMIRTHSKLPSEMKIELPVHDELLVEVEDKVPPVEAAQYLRERLEVDLQRYGKYPIEISKGANWAELEPVL